MAVKERLILIILTCCILYAALAVFKPRSMVKVDQRGSGGAIVRTVTVPKGGSVTIEVKGGGGGGPDVPNQSPM